MSLSEASEISKTDHRLVRLPTAPKLTYSIQGANERTRVFVRALDYFHSEVLPEMTATYWMTENADSTRKWLQAPQILQDMLFVSILGTQSIRANTNPPALYKHRGRVIKDLAEYLQRPAKQTPALSVASLTSILLQEVHLSPTSGFSVHLNAARKIVESYGGLKKCTSMPSMPLNLLIMFVQSDVLSATTSPADGLGCHRTKAQYDYPEAFEDFEGDVLDSPFPCPLPIFESLISINNLRTVSQPTKDDVLTAWKDEYFSIIDRLQSFDASEWSCNLPCLPETSGNVSSSPLTALTAVNDWATLAASYQAAAMIYLIESTRSQNRLKDAHVRETSISLTASALQQLQKHLLHLHETYPRRKPVAEQPALWKFMLWPTMVYAYMITMLGQGSHPNSLLLGGRSTAGTLYGELREIGTLVRSRSLMEGADNLENIAGKDGPVTWDRAFAQSFVFYL